MSKKQTVNTITDKRSHILSAETPFGISESYKSARTNLIFSLATSDKRIIVITSANPSEGKSTSCVNLAITLAETGASVLIIDADLRKPTISKLFNIRNQSGLSSVLGGFSTINEIINEDVRENLDIMGAGVIPPNPSELLASDMMLKLLITLKEHYDYILIDTPPINMVTDSQLMNNIISGIVFVVREGVTTHPDLKKAIRNVELANGKILGFLKVGCIPAKSKKYTENGYYGSYGSYGYKGITRDYDELEIDLENDED